MRKHFCFRYSLFVKRIIAIEVNLLGLVGLIKYIKVTSYMYASAFLTVCAGSNPQSFMVKFSKFSVMYMRRCAVFPQHW